MRRITVIAITAATTLAVTAGAVGIVFSVRRDADDGYMLMFSRQAAECDAGGGCSVLSLRQIQGVLLGIMQQHGAKGGTGI